MVAAWLLLLCATTLLSGGALDGDAVAISGVRAAITAAGPADRAVVVSANGTAGDAAVIDGPIRAELAHVVASTGGGVTRLAVAPAFAAASADPATVHTLVEIASYESIERHATLVEGAWPVAGAAPQQVALSAPAAAALGLRVRDRTSLVSRLDSSRRIDVELAAIFRPIAGDPYWLDPSFELGGSNVVGSFTTIGPMVVPGADIDAGRFGARSSYSWRALPDAAGYGVDTIETVRLAADEVDPHLRVVMPPNIQFQTATGLPAVLGALERSVLVSRAGVLVLVSQYAVLALYAIVLVAGMLVDRRRTESALLRARGASSGHLAAMALIEGTILTGSAAAVAPFLAVVAVRSLAGGPALEAAAGAASGGVRIAGVALPIGTDVLVVDAVATAFGIAALSLPAIGGIPSLAGVRASIARQAGQTLAQRLGLDVVLVVVGGIGLWQLVQYGAPLTRSARGVLGIDPLLVAAPALGLLAGALVATRLLPRAMELAEVPLARARGLVASIGGRAAARRPLRYTRSALLLMLAASLGTFAAAHVATWQRSQDDQAGYQAGAPVRVEPSVPVAGSASLGAALQSIPGVTASMPVDRQTVDAGREVRGGALLAVDADTAAAIVNPTPGVDPAALAGLFLQLAAARPAPVGLVLPGGASALRIRLDARVDTFIGGDPDPTVGAFPGIGLSVVLEDGRGRFVRLDAPTAGLLRGDGQRIEVPFATAAGAPSGPLRLRTLDLDLTAPAAVAVGGTLAVAGVEVRVGSSWQPAGLGPAAAGWAWSARSSGSGPFGGAPGADATWRFTFAATGTPEPPIFGSSGGVELRLQAATTSAGVDAIANPAFLGATGSGVGDVTTATLLGLAAPVRVIGTVAAFPTLDPGSPFLVVDGATLAELRFDATGSPPQPPDEWWLATADPAAVAAAVRSGPDPGATVITVPGRVAALRDDPVAGGVIGVLGLGSWAALLFAAIGFVVSAAVATRERLGELALLRALGLSDRQLMAWLGVEQALLLGVSVVAGVGLGALLAWLVLPFAVLTATGAPAVPTPVVVVPFDALVPLGVGALGILAGTLVVVRRQLLGLVIGDVLRGQAA